MGYINTFFSNNKETFQFCFWIFQGVFIVKAWNLANAKWGIDLATRKEVVQKKNEERIAELLQPIMELSGFYSWYPPGEIRELVTNYTHTDVLRIFRKQLRDLHKYNAEEIDKRSFALSAELDKVDKKLTEDCRYLDKVQRS